MQGYNVLLVFNAKMDRLLMCTRRKDPYRGLSNLIGGKIEEGENGLDAAYRELYEEAGIAEKDIRLRHLMDFTYHLSNCYVEVYVGKLKHDVNAVGDENALYWSDLNHNFFDKTQYAGEGNIGHMLELVNRHKSDLFDA